MRAIAERELPVIRYLLEQSGIDADLGSLEVEPMNDGGMGSLAFAPLDQSRKLGRKAADCHFFDADGAVVSVALYLDQSDQLFEVDVWRVDFNPVKKWPEYDDIAAGEG